jgi:hypothetical protein
MIAARYSAGDQGALKRRLKRGRQMPSKRVDNQRVDKTVPSCGQSKGWWMDERNDGELIARYALGMSEALEAMRKQR